MSYNIVIPNQSGENTTLEVDQGSSVIILGANGSGKTRLAAYIERSLGGNAHRIAAHRALALNPTVTKISQKEAMQGLKYGGAWEGINLAAREGSRWQARAAVALLNDFDYLLQTLFAEQTNTSLQTHQNLRAGVAFDVTSTKFELLKESWQELLPHRELHITGDDILVSVTGTEVRYSASEMSDGERAIFYLLGQALMAESNSLLIFDEPELHVHKSIMSKLWDRLEGLRADCAFIFITHDIEFASSRVADKYVITKFDPTPSWEISPVPEDEGFDESTVTLILGSRKPILFVEGNGESLDFATYRSCYPDWTVIPRGSCEQVIHSVTSMRQNAALTRVTCSGIVDADHYSQADIQYLDSLGIKVLPYSEIENVFIDLEVASEILSIEGFTNGEHGAKLAKFSDAVISSIDQTKIDQLVIRFCRRRIDRALKKIDLSAADSTERLKQVFNTEISSVNIDQLAEYAESSINSAIAEQDIRKLLSIYDNKGLMAIASTQLKKTNRLEFEQWLIRVLNNQQAPQLIATLKRILPVLTPA